MNQRVSKYVTEAQLPGSRQCDGRVLFHYQRYDNMFDMHNSCTIAGNPFLKRADSVANVSGFQVICKRAAAL